MKTRRIADLDLAPIGFGAMPLSVYDRPDEKDALRVIHAAIDAGITLIDTADVYCKGPEEIGHNEKIIARALRDIKGSKIVVATKGGLERFSDGSWPINGHPEHLKLACDESLRRLGVDCIDLYQLHAPDPVIPFAESVGTLSELKSRGKIRHIGLSNVSVRQIIEAETIVPIVSVQNFLNPFHRTDFSSGVIDLCKAREIAYISYSPFGGSRKGITEISTNLDLCRIGARYGVSSFQITLAWLLEISPVIIPIPGGRRIESVRDNAAAMNLHLDAQDLSELKKVFPTN